MKLFYLSVVIWMLFFMQSTPIDFKFKMISELLGILLMLSIMINFFSLKYLRKVTKDLPGYSKELLKK